MSETKVKAYNDSCIYRCRGFGKDYLFVPSTDNHVFFLTPDENGSRSPLNVYNPVVRDSAVEVGHEVARFAAFYSHAFVFRLPHYILHRVYKLDDDSGFLITTAKWFKQDKISDRTFAPTEEGARIIALSEYNTWLSGISRHLQHQTEPLNEELKNWVTFDGIM